MRVWQNSWRLAAGPFANITVQPAEYSFTTLRRRHQQLGEALSLPGAVFTDVDEQANRVRIGITPEADLTAFQAVLKAKGVPPRAVVIDRTEPVRFMYSLQERIRPLRGGTQIQFSGTCTMGFNAYTYNAFGQFDSLLFLTNSHCTEVQGGVEGTLYYQASRLASIDYVGREAADPEYFTGGVCPTGRRCRYSDAAKAYNDASGISVGLGWIARTTSRGRYTGSLTLDLNNVRFFITSETSAPLMGDWVDKMAARRAGLTVRCRERV